MVLKFVSYHVTMPIPEPKSNRDNDLRLRSENDQRKQDQLPPWARLSDNEVKNHQPSANPPSGVYSLAVTIHSIDAGVCSVSKPDTVNISLFSGKFIEHIEA